MHASSFFTPLLEGFNRRSLSQFQRRETGHAFFNFDRWVIGSDRIKAGECPAAKQPQQAECRLRVKRGRRGRAGEKVEVEKRAGSAKAAGSRMVKSNRGERQEIRG